MEASRSTDIVPHEASSAASHAAICFRISGIPSSWDRDVLQQQLKTIDPGLRNEMFELSELFPDCYYPTQLRVALLNVSYCTRYLRLIRSSGQRNHIIYNPAKIYLSIDVQFHDLTPMNAPETPIVADVIAITGLGGHAFGSWRSRAKTIPPLDRPMWLCDFLPKSLPNVRIMSYGYDSSLSDSSAGMNLLDYRRNFKDCLENARQDCRTRPIIFIGHSLGGILCIQTLIESSIHKEYYHIYNCIRGLILFGTPHNGLVVDDLHEMVDEENREAKYLLKQLEEGSIYLEEQRENLSRIWEDFRGKIVSFYETEKTPQVTMRQGEFSRDGLEVQKVQRMSAQLHLPREDRHPIKSNHTNMVKFDSVHNTAFITVVRRLKELCEVPLDHGNIDRRCLSEMFIPVVHDVVQSYSIDQKKYLETFQQISGLERDKDYFWIFHNLDYRCWLEQQRNHELCNKYSPGVPTLVLSGSPRVELAASYIVRNGPVEAQTKDGSEESIDIDEPNMDLCAYFFYGSKTRARFPQGSPSTNDLIIVCTFLQQLIECEDNALYGQTLLKTFLEKALELCNEKELLKVSGDLTRRLMNILKESSQEVLWSALECALVDAMKLSRNTGSKHSSQSYKTYHATFVLDFDDHFGDNEKALIRTVQRVIDRLRFARVYATAGLMVTCKSNTGDWDLKRPLEALIEYDQERQACLRTLRLHNARYEKVTIPHAYTGEWFRKNQEYQGWKTSENSKLLLVEGKPGSGKSTLTRYFNEHLLHPELNDGDIVAKFFYSERGGKLETDHCNMFKSLLYDILGADETFFIHFQQAYRKFQSSEFITQAPANWPRKVLEDTLRACVERHPLRRRFFLIIDALDESDTQGRTRMVESLYHLVNLPVVSNGCVVKIFLASRPITELRLRHIPGTRVLVQDHTKKDIQDYAQSLVRKLFDYDEDIEEKVVGYIVDSAEGVFLWVRLAIHELRLLLSKGKRRNPDNVLNRLKSLPTNLENFYVRILQRLQGDSDDVNDTGDISDTEDPCDDEDIAEGVRILQFCLFSPRAISMMEMNHAFALPSLLDDPTQPRTLEQIKRRLIHCTANFVETKRTSTSRSEADDPAVIVQVMHQTVREFFLKPHPKIKTSKHADVSDAQKAHRMIQRTCIQCIEHHYQEILQRFSNFNSVWSKHNLLKFVHYLDTRPFIKYSLEFIGGSLMDGTDQGMVELPDELKICIHNSPVDYAFSLLKPLATSSTDSGNIKTQLNTLLAIAAEEGCVIATGNLLAAGASAEAMDNGRTALQLAAKNGHELTTHILLVEGKANIEARDSGGHTALHLAAKNGHELTIHILLVEGKANIEARDSGGHTALHLASWTGHETIARILLVDGMANIEAEDADGLTAPYMAAWNGHEATARMLLSEGQTPGIKSNPLWDTSQVEEILERYRLPTIGRLKMYKGVYVLTFFWEGQEIDKNESLFLAKYMGEELKYATRVAAIEDSTSAQKTVETLIKWLVENYGNTSENLLIIHYVGDGIDDATDSLQWASFSRAQTPNLFSKPKWRLAESRRNIRKLFGNEKRASPNPDKDQGKVDWPDIQRDYLTGRDAKCKADVLLLLDCSHASLVSRCDPYRVWRSHKIELMAACAMNLQTPTPRLVNSFQPTFTKVLVNTLKNTTLQCSDINLDIRTLHSILCRHDNRLYQCPVLVDYAYARTPGSLSSINLHRLETKCLWQEEELNRLQREKFHIPDTFSLTVAQKSIIQQPFRFSRKLNNESKPYNAAYVLAFYWADDRYLRKHSEPSTILTTYMRETLKYATRMVVIEDNISAHESVNMLIKWLVENYGNTSENLLIIYYDGDGIEHATDSLQWANTNPAKGQGKVDWSNIQRDYLTGRDAECKADVLLLFDCSNASLASRCDCVQRGPNIELMAACAAGVTVPVSEYSWTFTKVFVKTLKEKIFQRSAIDTRTLHSLLCTDEARLQQCPILIELTQTSLPNIRLHPLDDVCEWQENSFEIDREIDL